MDEIERAFYLQLRESASLEKNVEVRFCRSLSNALFWVKFTEGKIAVFVNTNSIYKAAVKSYSVNFYYCVHFVTEYLRRIETAANKTPSSYFDGLTILNCISDITSGEKNAIYSPLRKRGCFDRKYRLRAVEADCAAKALVRTLTTPGGDITEAERARILEINDSLILYSSLPEMAYAGGKYPVFALPRALGEIRGGDFKIFDNFSAEMTFDELVKSSAHDPFCRGAAVRLAAFCNLKVDEKNAELLGEAVKLCSLGADYYKQCGRFWLVGENRVFMEKMMKMMNGFLEKYDVEYNFGRIHCLE